MIPSYSRTWMTCLYITIAFLQPEIEVYRKDSKSLPHLDDQSIDWEETVYLNIILHQVSVLLGQGYVKERLKSSIGKFYGRYGDLTKQYEVPLSRMLHDILDDDHIQ